MLLVVGNGTPRIYTSLASCPPSMPCENIMHNHLQPVRF